MASPPSSTRRALRALLITGFLWLLTCWTYAIHRIIAAAPPVTPLLKNHHNLHDEHAVSSDIRKLDQSSSASDVSINSISDFQIKQRSPTATQEKSLPAAPKTHLVFPLHAKSGTHHAYLYVGSPPQRQTLIVDTGSRLTAFPCKPFCSTCGIHASPRFDMNTSTSLSIVPCDECMLSRKDFELETYFKGDGVGGNSGDGDVNVDLMPDQVKRARLRGANANKRRTSHKSCKKSQCEINQRYTEGSSWDAIEVRDNVWLGFEDINESNLQHAQYSKPFVFGCQTSEEGLFQSQYADGIMGLSMYTQTIVGSWFKQGSIQHETFSLCFNSNGGHMSLGGVASTHDENYKNDNGAIHSTPMQYIPLARDNTWYYTVHVTSISIGDHVLPSDALQFMNDHKGTIVDSGTTDTFLSHKVAKVRIEMISSCATWITINDSSILLGVYSCMGKTC